MGILFLLTIFNFSLAQDVIDLKPDANQIKEFKNLKISSAKSFYCDCPIIEDKIYLKKCSYNFGSFSSIDTINYIIPLSSFTSNIIDNLCKNKDYKCLQNNKYFKELLKDPNNIYYVEPNISQKIGAQSYAYFKKNEKQTRLNACPIFFNTKKFFISTPKSGWYSRLKLYLNDKYPAMKIISSETEIKELHTISNAYPPSEEECIYSNKIANKTNYKNTISLTACSNKKGEKNE